MEIKDFDYFYNKDKEKKCLILGGAPSIQDIDYKNFDGIIISMGDVPIRLKNQCNVDYWINANGVFPIPDVHYEVINKVKHTTLLFAHSVVRKQDYSVIRNKIKTNWFEYDQRHFGARPCNQQIDSRFYLKEKKECCDYIGDITIQEFLQKKYNSIEHYSTASTVAIHALSLAVILGCKTIYIGGVEIPSDSNDYSYFGDSSILDILRNEHGGWNLERQRIKKFIMSVFNIRTKSVFYPDIPEILKDFEYLNNLCRCNDIDIFNLSETSNLRNIPYFKYLSPDLMNSR